MHPALQRVDHRPWPLPRGPWRWRQSWRDLLFAHWPVETARLRHLVPPSLRIDEFGGTSWVGIVPFRMEGVMARPLPDLPGLSAFPELNVRLYVEADGKPGVWFVSLDAANLPAVWAARRLFHLPYFHADMQTQTEVQNHRVCVRYQAVRRGRGPRVAFRATYTATAGPAGESFEATPGTLEHFLTARYCLYTQDGAGALLRANIHHAPWSLQNASATIGENTMGEAQGITLPGPPSLVHFSRRTDVVVWPLERVAR
ncbi:MAG: DUF2071 domain-containing protein [Myxococcales bacterium]